jgi:hypothetical protein
MIRPTSSRGIELRSSLHGLALLLGGLVLEPFLLSGCRLMDLLELSLKVDNPPPLLRRILQQVGPAFGPSTSDYHSTTRSSTSFQTHIIKQQQRVVDSSPSARY